MKHTKKRGQFNFVWIFAILAGGAILSLAIWGAVRTGDTLRYGADTEVARGISILTDPMQAGFADSSFGKITFKQETRLNNICLSGKFGKNEISVATKSGVGKAWNSAGGEISIHNKYIFSKEKNQGTEYYVFSKPFNFPYKVSDLLFLMSGRYCLINTPPSIRDEVSGIGIKNIVFENCSSGDERVCFGGGSNCDMIVYGSCSGDCSSIYDEGVVSKKDGDLKYVGNLMWGAIFSDKDIYNCNVKRLMFRTKEISEVYSEKTNLMNARNCGTNMKGELDAWSAETNNATDEDIISLKVVADNLEKKNEGELCGLW